MLVAFTFGFWWMGVEEGWFWIGFICFFRLLWLSMCRYLINVFGNMMEEFGFSRYYILGIL